MGNQPQATTAHVVHIDFEYMDIENVDSITKLIVDGYMRKLQSLLNRNILLNVIPNDVIKKCLFYYYEPEYFKTIGFQTKVHTDSNYKTLSIPTDTLTLIGNTTFGNVIIPSTINCICRWDITINSVDCKVPFLLIGVSTNIYNNHDKYISSIEDGYSYCFNPITEAIGLKTPNEQQYNFDEYIGPEPTFSNAIVPKTVSMELDLKNRQIVFYKNNVNQGIAFKNEQIKIGDNYNYHFGISLGAGSNVTLTKFKKEYK